MRKIIAGLAVGVGMLAGLGCAGNAEYVRKDKDGGVIALKAGTDEAEARKLMDKHLGTRYEVVERYDPKLRSTTGNDLLPGSKLANLLPKDDAGVTHISYRKLPDSQFGGNTPTGLPPAPKDGIVPVGRTQPKQAGTVNPPDLFAAPGQ